MDFVILLICFFTWLIRQVSADSLELIVEYGPKRLVNFKNIGSQEIFHWNTVGDVDMLLRWSGTANSTTDGISVKCVDEFAQILVRENGIPLPNPLNSSIPDGTLVNFADHLYSGSFKISPSEQGLDHDVIIPSLGISSNYFASVFLPQKQEQISVPGLTQDCRYYSELKVYRIIKLSKNVTNEISPMPNVTFDNHTSIPLERKFLNLFNVNFKASTQNLTEQVITTFFWNILPITDSGGTMVISLNFKQVLDLFNANLSVSNCLKSPANNLNSTNCFDNELLSNTENGTSIQRYIPYPISGQWSLSLEFKCESDNVSLCFNIYQSATVSVSIKSCIDGCQSSNKQGSCGLYRTDDVLFTACACKVGWKGIGCTDGTEAQSYSEQLLRTLLLTLSNFMFAACVGLAVYRKFYTEGLVYFFVCFMSTFYHACDQPGSAVYCIMPYNTLQYADFLGSITAIWFTLIALSKFSPKVESFCHVLGCLALAVGVSLDRFNVWTTIVPATLGVIFVIITWVCKCVRRKDCYPGKKKTVFSIIPGIICAGTGLSLFAFVETNDNYYIVHSLWHILMATAVLFLLPIGPKNHKMVYKTEDSSNFEPELTSRNEIIFDYSDGIDNDARV